jgi:hypothetical protein
MYNGLLTTKHEQAKREREMNKDNGPFLENNKGSVIVIVVIISSYSQIFVCTCMILDLLHLS